MRYENVERNNGEEHDPKSKSDKKRITDPDDNISQRGVEHVWKSVREQTDRR